MNEIPQRLQEIAEQIQASAARLQQVSTETAILLENLHDEITEMKEAFTGEVGFPIDLHEEERMEGAREKLFDKQLFPPFGGKITLGEFK